MNIRGLEEFAATWWKEKAKAEGYTQNGNASVREFLKAIALGHYSIVKNTLDS